MVLDTYKLLDSNKNVISITETGIAWTEDIGDYKNVNLNNQWLDVTNGKFSF
jgi:hypothetical protein